MVHAAQHAFGMCTVSALSTSAHGELAETQVIVTGLTTSCMFACSSYSIATGSASLGITRHICFTKLNVSAKDFAPQSVKGNKALISEADLSEGFIAPPKNKSARALNETKSGQLHDSFVAADICQVTSMLIPAVLWRHTSAQAIPRLCHHHCWIDSGLSPLSQLHAHDLACHSNAHHRASKPKAWLWPRSSGGKLASLQQLLQCQHGTHIQTHSNRDLCATSSIIWQQFSRQNTSTSTRNISSS